MEKIIEGSRITSIEHFYKEMKSILELPDYYGSNLDALWDCLTGWVETPLTLIWKDFESSRSYLGDYADRAMTVFHDAEKELDDFTVETR